MRRYVRNLGGTSVIADLVEGISGVDGSADITGGQIKFPATQNPSSNANTLDDYEEGTWTPIDGSVGGLTFTGASGTYLKIGNHVIASCTWTYPVTADGSAAKVGGLPFAVASGDANRQGTLTYTNSASANKIIPDAAGTIFSIFTAAGVAVANSAMSTTTNWAQCIYKA